MKITITLVLLLLAGSISSSAQMRFSNSAPKTMVSSASVYTPNPLILINSLETTMNALILDPDQIASVEILEDQSAVRRFGSKAREGAVVIELKDNRQLVRVREIYDHFKIPQHQQHLKLTINDKLVTDKELLLADMQLIEKLELRQQNVTANYRISFDEDTPYINIITVKQ